MYRLGCFLATIFFMVIWGMASCWVYYIIMYKLVYPNDVPSIMG